MRAPAIPPAEIGADLQPLYDDMRQGIERSFKGFLAIRQDGAWSALGRRGCATPSSASPSGNW